MTRITPDYLELQREMHGRVRGYGQSGHKHAWPVLLVAEVAGCASVLDYGCGQGTLGAALREQPWWQGEVREYDPAVEGKDAEPEPADLVVCTDVLEHIEPDYTSAVLRHIRVLARRAVYIAVSCVSGSKVLADGRDAHVNVRPPSLWLQLFEAEKYRIVYAFSRRNKSGDLADLYAWLR